MNRVITNLEELRELAPGAVFKSVEEYKGSIPYRVLDKQHPDDFSIRGIGNPDEDTPPFIVFPVEVTQDPQTEKSLSHGLDTCGFVRAQILEKPIRIIQPLPPVNSGQRDIPDKIYYLVAKEILRTGGDISAPFMKDAISHLIDQE